MKKLITLLTAFATIGTLSASVFADSTVATPQASQTADQLRNEIAGNNRQISLIQQQLKTAKAERVAVDIFIPASLVVATIGAVRYVSPIFNFDSSGPGVPGYWGKLAIGGVAAAAGGAIFHLYNTHQIDVMQAAMYQLQRQNTEAYKALSDLK